MIRSKKCKVLEIGMEVQPTVRTEEFALAFLSVYNNVRENKGTFLDMVMTYDSQLFIIIHPEDKEVVVNWLKNFYYCWQTDKMTIEEVTRTIIDDYEDDFNEDIILRHVGDFHELEDF